MLSSTIEKQGTGLLILHQATQIGFKTMRTMVTIITNHLNMHTKMMNQELLQRSP